MRSLLSSKDCKRPTRNRTTTTDAIPLVTLFPELAVLPRVALGRFPTPLERVAGLGAKLWIKRDDLCANPMGGNKVRALEFLLGSISNGRALITVGSAGSTHALAVAIYGKQVGGRVLVGRWEQEMNSVATVVADRILATASSAPIYRTPIGAYVWAWRKRLRGAHWIPAGGSTPLGILGHVNAGLELVEQLDAGFMEEPTHVVVPLGTGGTAAGLALAFAIARRNIVVVGVRVVPRLIGRAGHVHALADRTARLVERITHGAVPRVQGRSIVVIHDRYGGAYGRETDAGRTAADRLRSVSSIPLDATYSAKAFSTALDLAAREPTVFWLTFDHRILGAMTKPSEQQ
ncbi:MAG: pyridoxal-phosphate dependent enzyme [bacterium]